MGALAWPSLRGLPPRTPADKKAAPLCWEKIGRKCCAGGLLTPFETDAAQASELRL